MTIAAWHPSHRVLASCAGPRAGAVPRLFDHGRPSADHSPCLRGSRVDFAAAVGSSDRAVPVGPTGGWDAHGVRSKLHGAPDHDATPPAPVPCIADCAGTTVRAVTMAAWGRQWGRRSSSGYRRSWLGCNALPECMQSCTHVLLPSLPSPRGNTRSVLGSLDVTRPNDCQPERAHPHGRCFT